MGDFLLESSTAMRGLFVAVINFCTIFDVM